MAGIRSVARFLSVDEKKGTHQVVVGTLEDCVPVKRCETGYETVMKGVAKDVIRSHEMVRDDRREKNMRLVDRQANGNG